MDKQCDAEHYFGSLLFDTVCANINQKLKNIC